MISNYRYRFWIYLFLLGLLLSAIGFIVSGRKTETNYQRIDPSYQRIGYYTLDYLYIGGDSLLGTNMPLYVRTYTLGAIIEQVIKCESGFDNSKIGKAGEVGLAQFMPQTWEYFNKIRGTNLDIYNKEDQFNMISWAFENNLMYHWTCFCKIYPKSCP